jgi:putative DNA primase/helicase
LNAQQPHVVSMHVVWSQVTASLVAIVTPGARWSVDDAQCATGNVVLLSAEDAAADTLKPRLLVARADSRRCYMLGRGGGQHGAPRVRSLNLQCDLERLRRCCEVHLTLRLLLSYGIGPRLI